MKQAGKPIGFGLLIKQTAALILAVLVTGTACAQDGFSHGYSVFGKLDKPADFTHYAYVNPDAPTGGEMKTSYIGTFDSLNQFVTKGTGAFGLGHTYDRLMAYAHDELGANYGLIAQSVRPAPDHSWIEYIIRPEARWHDGVPISVEDIIFTLDTIKELGSPLRRRMLSDVAKAEKVGERTVRFTFTRPNQRKLSYTLGALEILPKHYWATRDFNKTTLEPPLTSGPYRIKSVDQGRSISYERVEDYWARDLPVRRGHYNFGTLTYEYYRDVNTRFEAFKAGDTNFRVEFSSALWAKGYNFNAIKTGDIVKAPIRTQDPATILAWSLNMRRDRFKDARVREALDLAFDFTWMNKNFFHNTYVRSNSYFANSTLAATGVPSGHELELLEPWRAALPPRLFTQEYRAPETDGSGKNRAALLKAMNLLKDAGWRVQNGVLTHKPSGKPFAAEFLVNNALMERAAGPHVRALKRLGIEASVRLVDSSQFFARITNFDYDLSVVYLPQASLPTRSLMDFWGSAAADRPGSLNFSGIKDPAVDAMLDIIATTNDPEKYFAAISAVDRILLWNHYLIPLYHAPESWRAHASELRSQPWPGPMYDDAFPETWWYESAEHAAIK